MEAFAVSDVILPRLVPDCAAYAIELPPRVIRKPLGRKLLAANGAVGEAEVGCLAGLRKDFLAVRGIRSQAEHDR